MTVENLTVEYRTGREYLDLQNGYELRPLDQGRFYLIVGPDGMQYSRFSSRDLAVAHIADRIADGSMVDYDA